MADIDSSVRLAIGLAQDGETRVTLVVPRRSGVLLRARQAARKAGVNVVAERVGTATITLRFSSRESAELAVRRDTPNNAWPFRLAWSAWRRVAHN